MRKITYILYSVLLFIATACNDNRVTHVTHKGETAKDLYTCSMHPDVLSDKPGKCPKPDCGMTLVKKEPAKKKAAK